MPSIVLTQAGKPQASYLINRPCTRIGRAQGNDIVLACPTVSSAHAILTLSGTHVSIQDLASSNGTYMDSTRIQHADLHDGSMVCIGDYTLKLVAERRAMAYEPTMLVRSSALLRKAYLQRLDGTLAGECIELTKVVSTIGQPGESMVTFIRRGDAFAVRCSDGPAPARLNGATLAETPLRLNPGDVLEMPSGRLQFLLLEPFAVRVRPDEKQRLASDVVWRVAPR
jgi:hypothetical protein